MSPEERAHPIARDIIHEAASIDLYTSADAFRWRTMIAEAIRAAEEGSREIALAVRAAVFLGEENRPYHEEFDKHDLTATHFIEYFNGEPAAACRVVHIGPNVEISRVCCRAQFRGQGVTQKMLDSVYDYLERLGFSEVQGRSTLTLLPYWQKQGWKVVDPTPFSHKRVLYFWLRKSLCAKEITLSPVTIWGDASHPPRPVSPATPASA